MNPTIINIRKKNLNKLGYCDLEDWLSENDNLYIGRYNHYVSGAIKSKWSNPYSVKKYGISRCLELYEEHIVNTLWNDIEELEGMTLGCWCKPNLCHGDILIKLYKLYIKKNWKF